MKIDMKTISQSKFERPIPDFSSVGVTIEKNPIKLKLKNILINDKEGNTARVHGTSEADIEQLKSSLTKGWDTTEYLPCVYKNKESVSDYSHILAFGYNRTYALLEAYGEDFEMLYDVVDCTPSQLLDIRAMENEGLPKNVNKETDIVKTMMLKIQEHGFPKDSDKIKEHLEKICPFRKSESIDNIVRQIETQSGMDVAFYEYNPSKAKRWSSDDSSIKYKFDGEETNGVHTYICKQGGAYRTIFRMMKQNNKSKKPCQVIFHCPRPTPKSPINEKRKRVMKDWKETMTALQTLGCDTSFMRVAGFFPQVKGTDNWSKLVKIN